MVLERFSTGNVSFPGLEQGTNTAGARDRPAACSSAPAASSWARRAWLEGADSEGG